MTFITALDLYSEWQGTIISRRFDDYGNVIDEYVADAVITAPGYDPGKVCYPAGRRPVSPRGFQRKEAQLWLS